MCEHLCRENGYIADKLEWLEAYHVCLVDAANASKPRSNGADYRLHYLIELFPLNMTEMHLTSAAEGETMPQYQKLKEKDLILGNRAYGTVKGITHAREQKAEYIFRLKANSFTPYTAEHEKFDLAKCPEEEWVPGKALEFQVKITVLYVSVRREKQQSKSKRSNGTSGNLTIEKSKENLEQSAKISMETSATKPSVTINGGNRQQGLPDSIVKQVLRANAHLTENRFHLRGRLASGQS